MLLLIISGHFNVLLLIIMNGALFCFSCMKRMNYTYITGVFPHQWLWPYSTPPNTSPPDQPCRGEDGGPGCQDVMSEQTCLGHTSEWCSVPVTVPYLCPRPCSGISKLYGLGQTPKSPIFFSFLIQTVLLLCYSLLGSLCQMKIFMKTFFKI